LDIQPLSVKGQKFKEADIDIVRDLKLEFIRFKEKILKELRRQEE
jgi:hypothetical protein